MKVRIAGFDWTIRPAAAEMLGNGFYGLTKFAEQEIAFTDSTSISHQRRTVLHEVLHVVNETYIGREWSELTEEVAVDQTSKGLFQVLEDNPTLCEWLWPVEEEYEFPTDPS